MFLDVNSTLKPQQPKEANTQGTVNTVNPSGVLNGRKTSVSLAAAYNGNSIGNSIGNSVGNNTSNSTNPLSSISSSRPPARRRETSDNNAFPGASGLASPLGGRTPRDESSWFGRKNTEPKESQPLAQQFAEPEEDLTMSASATAARPPNLGPLNRSNTAGSVLGSAGAAALWGGSGQASGPPSAGAFGSFSLTTPTSDKRFGSVRGESRLAHLLPKQDGADPAAPGGKVAGSANASAAPPAPASTSTAVPGSAAKDSWKPRQRTDTDPFGMADAGQQAAAQSASTLDTPVKNNRGDFGLSGLHIGSGLGEESLGSPDTNPFRSPPERSAATTLESDQPSHPALSSIGAIGGNGGHDSAGPFGSIRGGGYPGGAFDPTDRSQTSSAGTKGFPGLGNIAGWGNPMNVTTPDRERPPFSNAFGASLFSPGAGELSSAGFGGVPGGGVFGPPGTGPTGSLRSTTSKLNALFPASMQAQMSSGQESEGGGLGDSIPDLRQINPLGAIGREAVGSQVRDAESRSARALFDDSLDPAHGGGFPEQSSQPGLPSAAAALAAAFDAPPNLGGDAGQNLPRMMVMPDRMRWVYLDPQGQIQGPFTGLEMNDWYKAHFFTPDLRVKKVEDTEFEPLGQLIRRIGNSREPFLVPQMGVPHGQPSLSGTFVHGNHGGVVPPLVGAFPSYGRTLTAEEQNNLERRKQEEQYLIARQREMQVTGQHLPPFTPGRPGAVGVPAGALHHHSSAHSLQSQPSFGSMTAPLASAPPHIPGQIGAQSAFFDHAGMPQSTQPLGQSSSEFLRDEYGIDDRTMHASMQQSILGAVGNFPASAQDQGQSAAHNAEYNPLSQLPGVDQLRKDPQGFSERLKEFNMLREQHDASEYASALLAEAAAQSAQNQPTRAADLAEQVAALGRQLQSDAGISSADGGEAPTSPLNALSLAHRAQAHAAAAAASKQRKEADEAHSAVAQRAVQSDLPMPFPPPQLETTLAAPTAQRKSTLPDQFNTTSSRPETPDSASSSAVQPPPLAPWALQPGTESHRGPSLREIQAAEAEKAAKDEEVAAAARRSAAEQEAALQRERDKAAAAIAPGLPTSSTWGNGTPTPTTTAAAASSPWAKASAVKASAAVSVSSSATHGAADKKKTLAEIQREEEASKQKTRDLSSQSPSSLSHVGKRYADLASRTQPPSTTASPLSPAIAPPAAAAGWATVGAGGKVKTPTGPAAIRTAAVAPPPIKTPVSSTVRSVSRLLPSRADGSAAMEDFNKWLHREVSRGVTDDIDGESAI